MEINHTEAALKMLLEYAGNVAKINDILYRKDIAVSEQRFEEAIELRKLEAQLRSQLPTDNYFYAMASHFKSAEEQRATF